VEKVALSVYQTELMKAELRVAWMVGQRVDTRETVMVLHWAD
jgi:hypothetical protein